jgi:hypothetical protein
MQPMSGKMPNPRHFMRVFAVELIVYGILKVAFLLATIRYLGEPLARLFDSHLAAYGFVALVLIVFQGGGLDWLTSLIVRLIGVEHYD